MDALVQVRPSVATEISHRLELGPPAVAKFRGWGLKVARLALFLQTTASHIFHGIPSIDIHLNLRALLRAFVGY
jgi:hypothetical protein